MPVYEFECGACGPFTQLRSLDASSLPANCPHCGKVSPARWGMLGAAARKCAAPVYVLLAVVIG